jgi:hypothetical protein
LGLQALFFTAASPFPDELAFAFYRRLGDELIVFVEVQGLQKPYSLAGLKSLIRSTTNKDHARFLQKIYRHMAALDPAVFIEAVLPDDFTGALYKQIEFDLAENPNKILKEKFEHGKITKRSNQKSSLSRS